MKRLLLVLSVAFAAGCSGSSSSSTSTGGSTTTATNTTGANASTTNGSSSTASSTAASTNAAGSTSATHGSTSGSTGTNASTGTNVTTGSSGTTATTATNASNGSSGSTGTTGPTTCPGAGVSNDACAGATALTIDVAAPGNNANAKADFTIDQSGNCFYAYTGNDQVFSFTAPAAARFTFTVHATDTTQDTVLIEQDTCAATISDCPNASDSSGPGGDEAMQLTLTAGQQVFLVVGSFDCTSVGAFTITAHQLPPPPANDVCSGATALTVHAPGDTQTLSAQDTTLATDTGGSPVCGGVGGPDIYYSVTLNSAAHLVATATDTSGSTLSPVLTLYSGCAASAGGTELGCGFNSDNVSATVDFGSLAAGTYILMLDSYTAEGGTPGAADVTVTLSAPVAAPANDLCAAATALTPAVPGDTQTVAVSTVGAADDENGNLTLGASEGPDVFYSLTLTAAAHLTATLTPAANLADGGSDSLPVLGLSTSCGALADGGSADVAATPFSGFGAPAELDIPHLVAGTYLLRADSFTSVPVSSSLTVTLAADEPPPANDVCATAIPLTLGTPVNGDNTGATNDYTDDGTGTCTGYPQLDAADVVYSFTPASTGNFTFTVTPINTDPNTGPDFALYVNDTCYTAPISACLGGADANENGVAETVTVALTSGTTYLVFVDGYDPAYSTGAFTLGVVAGP